MNDSQIHQLALSLTPGIIIAWIARRYFTSGWAYNLFLLPGTIVHELLHFIVGLVTLGCPINFTIIPKKDGDRYTLGSVGFSNLNWINSPFIGLAPLLILYAIFYWALHLDGSVNSYIKFWLLTGFFISSGIPSSQDLKIATGPTTLIATTIFIGIAYVVKFYR